MTATARDYALALAGAGMKVFPLHGVLPDGNCTCGPDCPPKNRGKHPLVAGWQRMATSDPAVVASWFAEALGINYGVATGAASGVWVLDVDPDKGGWESMAQLCALHGAPPETMEVQSGSGGAHLYLRHAEGLRNRSAMLPGVDGRGDGGYVVGPGCKNARGEYLLVRAVDPAPIPEWLVNIIVTRAGGDKERDASDWAPAELSPAELQDARRRALEAARALPPGKEGDGGGKALLHLCRDLFRGWGLPDDEVTRAIIAEYCARCDPPWEDEKEIEHKVEQGKDGEADPQGRGVGYLLAEARVAAGLVPPPGETPAGLPIVKITTRQGEVTDQVVAAMAKRNGVYVRNDQLTAVYPGALPGEKKRLHALNKDLVGELITRCCHLEKYDQRQEDWVPAHPTPWLIGQVYSRFVWPGIPTLTDFVDAPVLRADGTVIDKPGHDAATGVYYAPSFEALPIPDAPTLEDAKAAAAELLDLVGEFPFSAPEHASAWMASLLTQFCRPAIKGSIPMVMIDGNNRGAGKTMLADIVSAVALGHTANKTPPTKDPEELRKQFSSAVLAGDTMLCLDNVVGEVGGPALDSALTNDGRWSDRILGGNTRVDKVVRMTVFATGNNISLRDDLVRRLLYVRLDSPEERPERRQGFKYTLPDHALRERPRYARACLVILRAYWAAGHPEVRLSGWGSFSSWSEAVRAPMVWCGLPDPAQGRKQLEEEVDEEPGQLELLLRGLERLQAAKTEGWTAADVASAVSSFMPEDRNEALREAVGALCPMRPGSNPTGKQIGYMLRKHRNRNINGRSIVKQHLDGHDKIGVWKVCPRARG